MKIIGVKQVCKNWKKEMVIHQCLIKNVTVTHFQWARHQKRITGWERACYLARVASMVGGDAGMLDERLLNHLCPKQVKQKQSKGPEGKKT